VVICVAIGIHADEIYLMLLTYQGHNFYSEPGSLAAPPLPSITSPIRHADAQMPGAGQLALNWFREWNVPCIYKGQQLGWQL
jgi:hypothetical protein